MMRRLVNNAGAAAPETVDDVPIGGLFKVVDFWPLYLKTSGGVFVVGDAGSGKDISLVSQLWYDDGSAGTASLSPLPEARRIERYYGQVWLTEEEQP
jgi:hypothetical protein